MINPVFRAMQAVVISNDSQKAELAGSGINDTVDITWISNPSEIPEGSSIAVMDLLFENDKARISLLEKFLPRTIIVNSVENTLAEIHPLFVRINAWNSLLSSHVIEAACSDKESRLVTEKLLMHFYKKVEWLPDEPGFITPRVISMIINEAFLALEENVSTKDEIDTAMKLGTNYPYGPFEWAERIGKEKIFSLLTRLSTSQARYTPSRKLGQD